MPWQVGLKPSQQAAVAHQALRPLPNQELTLPPALLLPLGRPHRAQAGQPAPHPLLLPRRRLDKGLTHGLAVLRVDQREQVRPQEQGPGVVVVGRRARARPPQQERLRGRVGEEHRGALLLRRRRRGLVGGEDEEEVGRLLDEELEDVEAAGLDEEFLDGLELAAAQVLAVLARALSVWEEWKEGRKEGRKGG